MNQESISDSNNPTDNDNNASPKPPERKKMKTNDKRRKTFHKTSNDGVQSTTKSSFSDQKNNPNIKHHHKQYNPNINKANSFGIGFCFKYLDDLSKKESDQLMLILASKKVEFEKFLYEVPSDLLSITLRVLAKVCQANFIEIMTGTILSQACSEKFLSKLEDYLLKLAYETETDKIKNKLYYDDVNRFWTDLTKFFKKVIELLPSKACDGLRPILEKMQMIFHFIETYRKDYKIDESIKIAVVDLFKDLNLGTKQIKNVKEISRIQDSVDLEDEEPPDNFRHLSIIPTVEDINNDKPFIRKSKIDEPYKSVHDYLDVQFRLLREDFICPLRNGINEYLHPKSENNRNSDLRVYKKVILESPRVHEDAIGIILCFQSLRNINWRHSKRLMYGALLLLSNDNFNNILFMTIANRDEKELMNGRILVEPCEGTHVTKQMYNTTFVMLESKIYFEPYWAVLNAMKYTQEDNFPMKNYLIHAEKSIKLPLYLRNVQELNYKEFKLPVGFDKDWPDANQLQLDETQLQAFRNALTQEFSLIQGPPGTGKTFIALEIVCTLLNNSNLWRKHGPIVIVCLTNHALDQFLEGILEHTNSIVRIGSRSKSEKLNPFTLKERRKVVKRVRGNDSTHLMYETKRKLEGILRSVQETQLDIKYLKTSEIIVPSKILNEYCDDMMLSNFNNQSLIKWLIKVDIKPHWCNVKRIELEKADASVDGCQQMTNIPEFERYYNRHMDDKLDIDYRFEVNKHAAKPFYPIEYINHEISVVQKEIFDYNNKLKFTNVQCDRRLTAFQYKRCDSLYKAKFRLEEELKNHPLLNQNRTPSNDSCWEHYWGWVRSSYESAFQKLASLQEEYRYVCLQLNDAKQLVDLATLKEHKVVGLTTTGAAKLSASLRALHAPIVLVEEAAEILESHVVCSMTNHCQQVILIGDHKQLQPKASVYKLGKHYNLNVSLFERMVRIRGDCAQLAYQHRMRPQFAKLISPSIYEKLHNDESVYNRPTVMGLKKNLFFLNHNNREESHNNEESWVNKHEVEFLVAFARHLVLQGYDPTEITILCTYTGQLFAFMREKERYLSILQNMRVTTVDNFQGEENKIVLLSLVRNNGEGNVGFLKEENRVCVALSRAKEGLYIMGNIDDLLFKNNIWSKIKDTLEEENAVGDVLELQCQIHPDQLILVKSASDFQKSPEGGCTNLCEVRMPCGHTCLSICHSRDREHRNFRCRENCLKTCPHNHPCLQLCFESCKPCKVKVERELKCGHTAQMLCSDDPDTFKCQTLIKVIRPNCKHEIEKCCHVDIEQAKCTHPCDIRLYCGHKCMNLCHIYDNLDPDHVEYKCMKKCARNYENCENDHPCTKLCSEVCGSCPIPVEKTRSCGHFYKQVSCGTDLEKEECLRSCNRNIPSCKHKCKLKCSDPCGNCQLQVEKSILECGHKIKVKCCEVPSPSLCSRSCPKILPCGHKCVSKCKDRCTTACQVTISLNKLGKCGHLLNIPCYLKETDPLSDGLLRYCMEPCNTQLACNHVCKGNCGSCQQGCIHVFCAEPCGQPLVCGHNCNIPCRKNCNNPCKMKCESKCRHSRCNKSCGEPCDPCVEPCTVGCVHKKCTKRCSEPCNIKPCNKPCQKKLKCGHSCVGFCGDTCPPLCRICDKEELTTLFFGSEDEPNARFVFLEDCGHCIESNGLFEWLHQNKDSIEVKRCPKCRTAIKECIRFTNELKANHANVELVKKKLFYGKYKDLQAAQKEYHLTATKLLSNPIIPVHTELREVLQDLHQKTKNFGKNRKHQRLNAQEIEACRVVLEIIRNVIEILSLFKHPDIPEHLDNDDLRVKLTLLSTKAKPNQKIIESYKFVHPQVKKILQSVPRSFEIAQQRLSDIQLELLRLEYMIKVCNYDVKNCSSGMPLLDQKEFHAVMSNLAGFRRFEPKFESEVLESIKKLNNEELKKAEQRMIVKAMGFKQGHWFRCPNGHPYTIGDCGGAMQISKCHCGAAIGGTQHRILSGNRFAGDIDEARQPAWPGNL